MIEIEDVLEANLTQEGSLDPRPNLRYKILDPAGKPFKNGKGQYPQWRVEKKQFDKLLKEGRIYFNKIKTKDGKFYYTINSCKINYINLNFKEFRCIFCCYFCNLIFW